MNETSYELQKGNVSGAIKLTKQTEILLSYANNIAISIIEQ